MYKHSCKINLTDLSTAIPQLPRFTRWQTGGAAAPGHHRLPELQPRGWSGMDPAEQGQAGTSDRATSEPCLVPPPPSTVPLQRGSRSFSPGWAGEPAAAPRASGLCHPLRPARLPAHSLSLGPAAWLRCGEEDRRAPRGMQLQPWHAALAHGAPEVVADDNLAALCEL